MRTRIIFILLAITGISWYSYQYFQSRQPVIDSYESCISAKDSVIQESYPATCITHTGSSFTQVISQPTFPTKPSPTPRTTKGIITTNHSTNQNTYTNPQVGIAFSYPLEYTLHDSFYSSFVDRGFLTIDQGEVISYPYFWINRGGYNDYMSDVYKDKEIWDMPVGTTISKELRDMEVTYTRVNNFAVGGIQARVFDRHESYKRVNIRVSYVKHEGKLFIFGMYYENINPEQYSQILSTFRFTDN